MTKGSRQDLKGVRSGRLVAISFAYYNPRTRTNYWLCRCDCGNEKVVVGTELKNGKVLSCGCYLKDNIRNFNRTHGKSYSREHKIWTCMKQRCVNVKNKNYQQYGARGIKVCDKWLESFEEFLKDMGDCPPGMTLDRIDPNGNYEKENCRWATWEQQHNNTRRSKFIEHNGCVMTVTQWERRLKVRPYQLANWLRKGGEDGKGKGRTIGSFMSFYAILI